MTDLRTRIAAAVVSVIGDTLGSGTELGLDVADAVIAELDMSIPCAANGGCKVRRSRGGRRKVTTDEIAEVTAVYYAAPYGLKHSAVMEHFGVGQARANLLIRRAREAGLIEKSGQGRAAFSTEKTDE
jgi:hypothetical protein